MSGGSGYAVNDTITVADAQLGGGGAALTFDVAQLVLIFNTGKYIKWASGSNTYEGTVYKNDGTDSIDVTLWDTTKRLSATSVIQTPQVQQLLLLLRSKVTIFILL